MCPMGKAVIFVELSASSEQLQMVIKYNLHQSLQVEDLNWLVEGHPPRYEKAVRLCLLKHVPGA